MVGENFEFLMSEMSKNVVNYQKSDFPQAEIRKFKFLTKTIFPKALWKVTSSQAEPFGKFWVLPEMFWGNDPMLCNLE